MCVCVYVFFNRRYIDVLHKFGCKSKAEQTLLFLMQIVVMDIFRATQTYTVYNVDSTSVILHLYLYTKKKRLTEMELSQYDMFAYVYLHGAPFNRN